MRNRSIVAFCVLLAGCTASLSQDKPATPALMAQTSPTLHSRLTAFLQDNSDYRLLEFEDLGRLRDTYGAETEWKPSSLGDTNGDGYEDIVAVIVKKSGTNRFNVICFHGSADAKASEPLWPIRDKAELIIEVTAKRGEIWPAFCRECDANSRLRWVDSGYEWGIYAVGEQACLFGGTKVFAKPDTQDSPITILKRSREAKILEMGAKPAGWERWYMVKSVTDREPFSGWVLKYNDEEPGVCEEP
jgi:hypothetical protein